MAVTATATEQVVEDILHQLHLREDTHIFRASFDRKNLTYQVWPKKAAMQQLTAYLAKHKGESGIIYCLSRDSTERMASSLQEHGHNAKPYHAGLEKDIRSHTQELFDNDKLDIVCATIAFGMGIDKPNVRFVIHFDVPKSIPSYYQETGRGGRDGLPSDCILFYQNGDRQKYMMFFDEKSPGERERAIAELDTMCDLAEATACRRRELLAYFGESYSEPSCGSCDNCLSTQRAISFDGTRAAQKFLSCVARVNEKFGASHIISILRGSESAKVIEWRHHKLSTYGVGKEHSSTEWRHFANEFRRQGLIIQDHANHSVVRITAKGWEVLKKLRTVSLQLPNVIVEVSRQAIDLPDENQLLFEELRRLRRDIAQQKNVPPYVIFNDYTLKEIAGRLPSNNREFLAISGVGEQKAREYGAAFLAITHGFRERHESVSSVESVRHTQPEPPGGDSAFETLLLYNKGYTPEHIAQERELTISTISTHLASLIQEGHIQTIESLVPIRKIKTIREAFSRLGSVMLAPVKNHLGDGYTYEELRYVRAFDSRTTLNAKA